MTSATSLRPLLTGTHRYDKTLSTRGRGRGVVIEAPILAYLVETRNGRILYDVGCDYAKLDDPVLRARYYGAADFPFGPPEMTEEQFLPNRLADLGLDPLDIDVVFCGHLHFDHCGGLGLMSHADIHVHRDELAAARSRADAAYFASDFAGDFNWREQGGEYDLAAGVRALETPGHTAGHMSMWIELPRGRPVILAGDAADLTENIDEEIAPGLCYRDREDVAVASIRYLKSLAESTGAWLWPNHDMAFYRSLRPFPQCYP